MHIRRAAHTRRQVETVLFFRVKTFEGVASTFLDWKTRHADQEQRALSIGTTNRPSPLVAHSHAFADGRKVVSKKNFPVAFV